MFELLLYADMKCADAADMIRRIHAHDYMSNEVKVELVEVLQEATPHCSWDAND